MYDHDLLVIGDDPAGLATATHAARRGFSVGLVHPPIDGLQSGSALSESLRGLLPELAVDVLRGAVDHSARSGRVPLAQLRRLVIRRVESVSSARLDSVRSRGVAMYVGHPRFLDDHSVEVAGTDTATTLSAKAIAVATGASLANDLQLERVAGFVVDVDEILLADDAPGRLVVIGADPCGMEFAGLFGVTGSRVTVVNGSLLGSEADAGADSLFDVTMALGVRFRLGAEVVGLDLCERSQRDSVQVHLDSGERLVADRVLAASRRVGRTHTLDLGAAGLVADDCHRLWCDHQYRTWQDHIFGVGDVVGFAPRELPIDEQARVVVDTLTKRSGVPAPLGINRRSRGRKLRLLGD